MASPAPTSVGLVHVSRGQADEVGSLDAGSVAVLHGSGHAGDAGGLGVVHVCIVRVWRTRVQR